MLTGEEELQALAYYTNNTTIRMVNDNEHQAMFNVGGQHFSIGVPYETEDECNWIRRRLSEALVRLSCVSQ